ncbi:N-acetylglucosamine kinase [Aquimarina sp. 2201CG14-23]|uniref:N-acetylglucosamine kinase n=1 Tax=Aquimarina mycalae TaxID=3040073 RepID=UPI002477CD45|nr:N-acetylglucosamine kinase [Aquimarina sp. 2201CG14-23]MDH7444527.1 N-acetylglucosamine kinase [Aquimarina sp. 2201CG14-23]
MILVVDSGSSKCDWIIADKAGKYVAKSKTKGLNPLILSSKEIEETLWEASEIVSFKNLISEIYFYGAGCGTVEANCKIKGCLSSVFKNSKTIDIKEDIVGAVYAATKKPGVIAILGTGSNCCYFNGDEIIQKAPSLGYMIADDASGNYFGKELLKSFYLHQMPEDLAFSFIEQYDADLNTLFQKLYNSRYPNRYLASYASFIFKHKEHPFIQKILDKGIRMFVENYLMLYVEELKNTPIHFVGSVAYYAQDTINKILQEKGYVVRSFIQRPIDELIKTLIFSSTSTSLEKIS